MHRLLLSSSSAAGAMRGPPWRVGEDTVDALTA